MDQLGMLAASGLRARMESLDMLANNLANAGTSGFKMDREFYSLFVGAGSPLPTSDPLSVKAPVIDRQWTDFSQGLLQVTGNPLDLALSGEGFFTVKGGSTPLYTRAGSFSVAKDGTLSTAEGYPLMDVSGTPIRVNGAVPIEITRDGTVRQQGQDVGRLAVVRFQDASVLAKQGNTYFRAADPNAKPQSADAAQVQQGKIEASNVGTAESAVRIVSIMRQFEMLQKAVAISSDMNRRAVEEVAKVGG